MLDFTSALYLGRPALPAQLPAGLGLTTGQPAALRESGLAGAVGAEVARRQGLEAGLLAPSTLHLFWDVVHLLPPKAVLLLDEALYPVGRWGAEHALLRGHQVVRFRSGDLAQLGRLLAAYARAGRVPWLLSDGWLLAAGRPAPLADYQRLLRPFPGSVLLVDDTQAFGLLGAAPGPGSPWGRGGGGSLVHAGVAGAGVLTITSLAKGLGVPVAVLAGSATHLTRFRQRSETRVHTSPASELHAWLAAQALHQDARSGDVRRHRLLCRICQFRQALTAGGLRPAGGLFPVQKLRLSAAHAAFGLHEYLRRRGIRVLLLADARRPTVPEVACCLRADHSVADIGQLSRAIAVGLRQLEPGLQIEAPGNAQHHWKGG
ncbi:PLP-dependent aminotransferase family protein [Hymenobacter rubripertinctus]|uniref:Pyridoxal phosphate-dependent aminotransferase family protein n=1 Tax=Hymenobacter rubripertinctus TaxID=2029981 RepID=A0A418R0M2_9BACT|nr:pyridoxal phosphate-dependent aminotransferase family protein [Hymenobacter rubripertinctus]RIY11010.1 hypothetical protein D0T11_08345 [Hymenobacter rubripertinctus]